MDFITDRTQADVDRRAYLARKGLANMSQTELAEWLAPSKGAYNYTDLNRVENAVAKIKDLMSALRRDIDLYDTRKWTMDDVPSPTDMQKYLYNVKVIRDALPELHYVMPEAPVSMVNFTYAQANAVEAILAYALEYVENVVEIFPFSGEIFGGESYD